jgi:hypothetical protein
MSFHQLCAMSRSKRKPILIVMLRNDSEEAVEYAANALQTEQV